MCACTRAWVREWGSAWGSALVSEWEGEFVIYNTEYRNTGPENEGVLEIACCMSGAGQWVPWSTPYAGVCWRDEGWVPGGMSYESTEKEEFQNPRHIWAGPDTKFQEAHHICGWGKGSRFSNRAPYRRFKTDHCSKCPVRHIRSQWKR